MRGRPLESKTLVKILELVPLSLSNEPLFKIKLNVRRKVLHYHLCSCVFFSLKDREYSSRELVRALNLGYKPCPALENIDLANLCISGSLTSFLHTGKDTVEALDELEKLHTEIKCMDYQIVGLITFLRFTDRFYKLFNDHYLTIAGKTNYRATPTKDEELAATLQVLRAGFLEKFSYLISEVRSSEFEAMVLRLVKENSKRLSLKKQDFSAQKGYFHATNVLGFIREDFRITNLNYVEYDSRDYWSGPSPEESDTYRLIHALVLIYLTDPFEGTKDATPINTSEWVYTLINNLKVKHIGNVVLSGFYTEVNAGAWEIALELLNDDKDSPYYLFDQAYAAGIALQG